MGRERRDELISGRTGENRHVRIFGAELGHRDVMRDEVNVLFGDGTNQSVGLCR